MKKPSLILLLIVAASALPVSSAVPGVINYQGRLTDNTPQQGLVSGTLTMEFSIWDDQVGGTSLWNETQSVQVAGGLFNAMLGQTTPIPPTVFAGGAQRYLEVHVSGETLAPRQRIATTPFANVAASADDASGLGGLPAASYQQRIASACPAGFAINAVAANGTVTCVQSAAPGCLNGDCRTSWNNQDANSVSPMPRSCPAGQVALSTGPFHWACSTICGFGSMDCDGNANNGCEVMVATNLNNCGGCGVVCSSNHMTPSCSNGVCGGVCAAGFSDCNGNKQADGCEIATGTDPDNCGCGIVCSANNMATRTCASGVCNGTCVANFADCNANKQTDGCEINTLTDPNNCGGCGIVCSNLNMATRTCNGGVCDGTCNAGFVDCNGDKLVDGCEADANAPCVPQFTGAFVAGKVSPYLCSEWQAFGTRISPSTTYSLVNIKGTRDGVGVSCSGDTANSLCQAVGAGTPFGPVVCDGHTWLVGIGCGVAGAVELTASGADCVCNSGDTARPCVGTVNWGGVNGTTCGAPSQTITVTCQ